MASSVIKLGFNGELRRVHIQAVDDLTLTDLTRHIVNIFSGLSPPFSIQYMDDEGDAITIKSNFEVSEAVQVMRSVGRTIRFDVSGGVTGGTSESGRARTASTQIEADFATVPARLLQVVEQWDVSDESEAQTKAAIASILVNSDFEAAYGAFASKPQWWGLLLQVQESLDTKQEFRAVEEKLLSAANADILPSAVAFFSSRIPNFVDIFPLVKEYIPQIVQKLRMLQLKREEEILSLAKYSAPRSPKPAPGSPKAKPLVPTPAPPAALEAPPAPPAQASVPAPPPAPPVEAAAEFLGDVSIPDGTVVKQGDVFRKIWRLKNASSEAWPANCKLVCVGGSDLDLAEPLQSLPKVNSNESVDVGVALKAPAFPGRFVQFWRVETADGHRFGHRMWADIVVPLAKDDGRSSAAIQETTDEVVEDSAPAPAPAPPAEVRAQAGSSQEETWAAQLSELRSMGFSDAETNIRLLEEANGNMDMVIDRLLS